MLLAHVHITACLAQLHLLVPTILTRAHPTGRSLFKDSVLPTSAKILPWPRSYCSLPREAPSCFFRSLHKCHSLGEAFRTTHLKHNPFTTLVFLSLSCIPIIFISWLPWLEWKLSKARNVALWCICQFLAHWTVPSQSSGACLCMHVL